MRQAAQAEASPQQPGAARVGAGALQTIGGGRHLKRFVLAAMLLLAVTIASTVFRSNIIYQSSLRSPSGIWDVGSLGQGAACTFQADGYHLAGSANCGASFAPPGDFVLTIDVQALQDADPDHTYGLEVRATLVSSGSGMDLHGYGFVINPLHGWAFLKILGKQEWVLASGTNDSLQPGLQVTNTLEITASGAQFNLAVNGIPIGQVEDTTFFSGALRVVNAARSQSEVVFTNLSITGAP